jgi:tripartite ATP-independent transporter DctM subunit
MTATAGLIGLVICFVLILARMPIAFAFGIVGLVGIFTIKGWQAGCSTVFVQSYSYMTNYVWTTIPMYLLMGFLAMQSRLTDEFFYGIRAWLGHRKGGLLSAIVLGNGAFGACCGVSIAAATAFTAISLPETRKHGQDDGLTLGTICGSSNLSILIPPSFGFVLFGAITGTSISRLFMGGIVPGIILIVLFLITIQLILWRKPELAPTVAKATWAERTRGTLGMWVLVVVFGVIIGGMYFGLFTPVEAAGVGTFLIVVLGMVRRKLTWVGVKYALMETMLTSAMVFFLVIGCAVFNIFLAVSGTSQLLGDLLSAFTQSPYVFMLVLSAIFLVLGCFLDIAALTVLLLPITFPIAMQLGIDPVLFGVQQTMIMNIGTVSPPFGIVVYAVAGIVPDVPMFRIFRGTVPFLVAMLILAIAAIFLPQMSLWLPGTMFGE